MIVKNKDLDNYVQSIKDYRDEIKRDVLKSNKLIKSEIEIRRNHKIIIGSPTILPDEKACHKTEDILKICIYNINGNSNEIKLTPSDIKISEGTLEDINIDEENTRRIMDLINGINAEASHNISGIRIPIYIININNILSNGNRNEVTVK